MLIDFEYDGERLSDYGMIVASFEGPSESQSIGNVLSSPALKPSGSNRYINIGIDYTEPFKASLGVIKYDCSPVNGNKELESMFFELSSDELNDVLYWLNKKSYKKFKAIYDDGSFADCYYMCIINVEAVKQGSRIIGLNLEIEADSPFAYFEDIKTKATVSLNQPISVVSNSNEIGHCDTKFEVKILEQGNLEIVNSLEENNPTIIKNCKVGETITLDSRYKIILSDFNHQNLADDFNYHFPRIKIGKKGQSNTFSFNLQCEVVITHTPVQKVGMVV